MEVYEKADTQRDFRKEAQSVRQGYRCSEYEEKTLDNQTGNG